MNKLEATRKWVGEFNAISHSLIERAFKDDIDNWVELTPIVEGDTVYYNGEYLDVDKVELHKNNFGSINDDSKVFLKKETDISIFLSDEELTAVCINNQKLNIIEYDFLKSMLILEGNKKISFSDIRNVYFKEKGSEFDIKAKVLNIEKVDSSSFSKCQDFEVNLTLSQTIVDYYDVEHDYDSWLPAWGTLWTFGNGCDERWALENPDVIAECGFRIFQDQETSDIYLGIDGAGYNFYEMHWVPLYEARGLQWHTEHFTALN